MYVYMHVICVMLKNAPISAIFRLHSAPAAPQSREVRGGGG